MSFKDKIFAYFQIKEVTAVLRLHFNKKTGEKEWALLDSKGERVLEWYGKEKPSDERVEKSERRVQWFKNKG